MARKSWRERLENGDEAVVKPCPKNIAGMKQGQMMLIPTARQFDDLIRTIPEGRSMSMPEVRAALAAANGAEVTCPITSGFRIRVVAEVAGEQLDAGAEPETVTPVWRVLDDTSPTFAKLENGAAELRRLRLAERL